MFIVTPAHLALGTGSPTGGGQVYLGGGGRCHLYMPGRVPYAAPGVPG